MNFLTTGRRLRGRPRAVPRVRRQRLRPHPVRRLLLRRRRRRLHHQVRRRPARVRVRGQAEGGRRRGQLEEGKRGGGEGGGVLGRQQAGRRRIREVGTKKKLLLIFRFLHTTISPIPLPQFWLFLFLPEAYLYSMYCLIREFPRPQILGLLLA